MDTTNPTYRKVKRWIKIVVGMTVLVFGIALLVLPGPAIVFIPLGLIILATELVWAKKLLTRVRKKLKIKNSN